MGDSAHILATALRDPLRTALDLGGDVISLCAAAAIDMSLLRDPGSHSHNSFPLQSFVALNQIAATQLGAPHFGRVVGAGFDLANLGDVGRAALAAPTLGSALRLVERAFLAVQSETEFRLRVEDGTATLSYRILDPDIWPRDQDSELTIGVFTSLVACVAGPGWRPAVLSFEHPAQGAERRSGGDLRCPVIYGASNNTLVFEEGLLDRAMPDRDPQRFRTLSAELSAVVQQIEKGTPITMRARGLILRQLGSGPLSQSAIARALGMSPRGLRRHLAEEGTSFAELLGTCRDRVAMRLLQRTDFALPEIADRLGYSETSGFERAFLRRTGQTPAVFRRLHRNSA